MRILSFQPTSTEMAYALGAGRSIVGVSHECSYPPAARRKPVVSTCVFDPETMTSGQINRAVAKATKRGESLYRVDQALVRRLRPDLFLTQSLCEVCATSPTDLTQALKAVDPRPKVLSLHAHDFEGMFADLRELADAVGADARPLERSLRRRLEAVARRTRRLPRRRVFLMEWIDPVYASGHWVPEMVERAGGRDGLATPGKPSRPIEWAALAEYAPDVLVVMPCGFSMERTRRELPTVTRRREWASLPAVRNGEVYLADGPSYFNGAGPRLIDGVEILSEIFPPGSFPRKHRKGWRKYAET